MLFSIRIRITGSNQLIYIFFSIGKIVEVVIEIIIRESRNLLFRPLDLNLQLVSGRLHIQILIDPGIFFDHIIELCFRNRINAVICGSGRKHCFRQPFLIRHKLIPRRIAIVAYQIVCNTIIPSLLQILVYLTHHLKSNSCGIFHMEYLFIKIFWKHAPNIVNPQILAVIPQSRKQGAIFKTSKAASIHRGKHKAVILIGILMTAVVCNRD